MKNIVLSAVAVFAMSSFAVAGGDIAPIEEPVVEEVVVVENLDAGLYLGLGYGFLTGESTDYHRGLDVTLIDEDFNQIMIQAGYKFNSYVAIEGRYWFGLDTGIDFADDFLDVDQSVDSWGIYVKPMYPVTDAFDVYALLGYAGSEYEVSNYGSTYTPDLDLDGFSWGLGVAYSFNENVSIFADYVSLYDDDNDWTEEGNIVHTISDKISTINVGVSYNF